MAYRVIITSLAQHRLDMYIGYTATVLCNVAAARAIRDDAKLTKQRLSIVASNLMLCTNPILRKYEYRKIMFQKHDYFMLYRIDGNNVIVDGMYHELQDYESVFVNEMHLEE